VRKLTVLEPPCLRLCVNKAEAWLQQSISVLVCQTHVFWSSTHFANEMSKHAKLMYFEPLMQFEPSDNPNNHI